MEREELKRRIEKLIGLRKLFLFLGIFLLVGGVTATIVYSILNPVNIDYEYGFDVTLDQIIMMISDPGYIFITTLTSIMIDAGIVLLILRAALLGTRLKKSVDELRELVNRPREDIDTSMWR